MWSIFSCASWLSVFVFFFKDFFLKMVDLCLDRQSLNLWPLLITEKLHSIGLMKREGPGAISPSGLGKGNDWCPTPTLLLPLPRCLNSHLFFSVNSCEPCLHWGENVPLALSTCSVPPSTFYCQISRGPTLWV